MSGNRQASRGLPKGAPQRGNGGTLFVSFANTELPVSRQYERYEIEGSGSGTVAKLTPLPKGYTHSLKFKVPVTFVNSAQLLCPGGANVVFDAGDSALVRSNGDGIWQLIARFPYRALGQSKTRFVFEGDSLADVALYGTWPTLLPKTSAYFAEGDSFYYATSGDHASSMIGQFATQGATAAPPAGGLGLYFPWGGTNDIAGGDSAATVYGYLTTMWAAGRASGFKVVAFTIMPRGDTNSTKNAEVDALNALILSDPTLYDFLIRPDVFLPNCGDLTYFLPDTVHLNAAGNALVAQNVVAVVLGAKRILQTSGDATDFHGAQVNGFLQVSQEFGDTAVTANNSYMADQNIVTWVGGMAISTQRVAAPFTSRPDISRGLKIEVTTADASVASGDALFCESRIEGERLRGKLNFGTTIGVPVSIGRMLRSNVNIRGHLAVVNGAGNRSYVIPFDLVADTDKYVAITIPPDRSGTWLSDTGIGLRIYWTFMAGSSWQTPANAWAAGVLLGASDTGNLCATVGNKVHLGPMVVVPGIVLPSAVELMRCQRPLAEELQACKRYMQIYPGALALVAEATGALRYDFTGYWPVEMRATPTVTFGSPSYTNSSGLTNNGSTAQQQSWYLTAGGAGLAYATADIKALARL
jgi:hypothetical protein